MPSIYRMSKEPWSQARKKMVGTLQEIFPKSLVDMVISQTPQESMQSGAFGLVGPMMATGGGAPAINRPSDYLKAFWDLGQKIPQGRTEQEAIEGALQYMKDPQAINDMLELLGILGRKAEYMD